MPSNSLTKWKIDRADALDEIESAHAVVGGTGPGRRYATQQINYAYATLLSSHFQGFCRDLHSESVDHVIAAVPMRLQGLLRIELQWNRSLDRGNPHPGAIGIDFNRLGIHIWSDVNRLSTGNSRRHKLLQELVDWRNAIAHQDFHPVGNISTLHLSTVRAWRRAIAALADSFDHVMYDYLSVLTGRPPW